MKTLDETRPILTEIAAAIEQAGGRAYLVGGSVRDELLNRPIQDLDVEVFRLSYGQLESVLSKFGDVMTHGTFGIFQIAHLPIDFAMPRKEKRIGQRHTDFSIDVDEHLPLPIAASRRDFTVNALMKDILTGEILDFYHGQEDLQNKTLRAVCSSSFIEDELRVFRAARFASSLNFTVDEATIKLCQSMKVTSLSRERVAQELNSVLLKSKKPSVFFDTLRQMNQLSFWFQEVADLIGVPQNEKHHAEGDAYRHTLMVLDEASQFVHQGKIEQPLAFMLVALCHDLGKKTTTFTDEKGIIHSYDHQFAGIELTKHLIHRLYGNSKMMPTITSLVKHHMDLRFLCSQKSRLAKSRTLLDQVASANDLVYLTMADGQGRISETSHIEQDRQDFMQRYEDYLEFCRIPQLTGQDLIELGYQPSADFKKMLERSKELSYRGHSREMIVRQLEQEFKKNK